MRGSRANAQLASEELPTFPEGITFHSLRRTYVALRAELGEHPAVTAPQVVEYVSWFNHERLHESVGDRSPVEFEDLYVRQGVQLSYPS